MRTRQYQRNSSLTDDQDDDETHAIAPRSAFRYKPRPNDAMYSGPPPPIRRKSLIAGKHAPVQAGQRIRPHWMVYVGGILMVGIIGWLAFTIAGNIWQSKLDDWTYGTPRTYQADAVVGHGDSTAHPSHFIAENLHGQIIVIEYPSGSVSNAKSYVITTLPNNDPSVPVRLVFRDVNNDGKLDMLVLIGDPGNQLQVILYNTGSQFTSKP